MSCHVNGRPNQPRDEPKDENDHCEHAAQSRRQGVYPLAEEFNLLVMADEVVSLISKVIYPPGH
jgi:hypothetical protein